MSDYSYSLADDYDRLGDSLVPKILPNGKYDCLVVGATTGQSQAGKPKINITLEVMDGPHAGERVNETIYWSPESEVASRIFASSLAVMGASPEWVKQTRPTFEEIAEHITGAKIQISAKEDEYNGQPRNRVNFSKALEAPPAAPQQQAVSLDAPATQQAAQAPQQAQQGQWPTL